MNVIELPDLRNGYVDLAIWLTERGRRSSSRGLATTALRHVLIELPDPTGVVLPVGVNRRVNTRLAAVEALQLMSGTFDADLLLRAAPTYADVMVDPASLAYGAYGPRLRYQLDNLVGLLRREPDTRRAVQLIWREDDLYHDGDRPCTLTLQFQLDEDGRLDLLVNMRSQDLFRGVPYDLFMFTQTQLSLARQLDIEVGRYTHVVGNLHLYDTDREAAGMLVKCRPDQPPPTDYPRGVVPVEPVDTFTEVAAWLVNHEFDEREAAANPWYVRQLAQLGTTRLTNVEVDR